MPASSHVPAPDFNSDVEPLPGSVITLVNVFAPVLTALAFIHFCLERLAELRRSPREVLLKTS